MARSGVAFHTSLLVNACAAILLLGLCLLLVALLANERTVAKLSELLTRQVIATTDAKLRGFFEPVQASIKIATERATDGEFDDFPLDQMDRYFYPLVERLPQVSSLMYAHANGDEYMLLKSKETWMSRHTRPDSWGDRQQLRTLKPGGTITVEEGVIDYDARRRPWHQGALERFREVGEASPLRERIHWTVPYRFFTTKEPGITASLAFRTRSGRLAVIAFDILLSDISQFTIGLPIAERGKVFVLRGEPDNPKDMVVIGLPADPRFDGVEKILRFVLSPPHGLGGPVASFVDEAIGPDGGELGKPLAFRHEGERWWGELARSTLQVSDDVWIGAVVPEKELLAGLPRMELMVILATAVFIVLAVLRSFQMAKGYSRPITELSQQGERMQRLNFEPGTAVESHITEIRHLGATMERMRGALQSYSAVREDMRVARSIRTMTVPSDLALAPGCTLRAWHEPGDDVGGEAYDVVALSSPARAGEALREAVAIIVFDVPGSGVGTTVLGSELRAAFRAQLTHEQGLGELASSLNEFVSRHLSGAGPVRARIAVLDASRRYMDVICLGSEPVLHYRSANDEVVCIEGGLPGLGLREHIESPPPSRIELAGGDVVVFASDGILDAMNDDRRRFGVEGIVRALRDAPEPGADEVVARVRAGLQAYGVGQTGDRTLLVVCASPDEAGRGPCPGSSPPR